MRRQPTSLTTATKTDELFVELYDDLHANAARRLAAEGRGTLLQPPDLLHDAYLRLVQGRIDGWASPQAFFAAAASTIRRVLIDEARRRKAQKRGGGAERVRVDVRELLAPPIEVGLQDLDAAIEALAALMPEWSEMVELRFFGGLTVPQVAEALNRPVHQVRRDWEQARDWLRERMGLDRED